MDNIVSTEKAQIVINFRSDAPTLIMRYATLEKAVAEHASLITAWRNVPVGGRIAVHTVDGDMFNAEVDVCQIASVSIVDHAVYSNFIPFV